MNNSDEELRDTSPHVEAECSECSWRYFRHQADEIAGMTGDRMDDIIDRQAGLHTKATGHEVSVE